MSAGLGVGQRVLILFYALFPQDGCSANDSQPTFKILTENVVCGKSGVTCSRAVTVLLGVSVWGLPNFLGVQGLAALGLCHPLPRPSSPHRGSSVPRRRTATQRGGILPQAPSQPSGQFPGRSETRQRQALAGGPWPRAS